MSPTKNPAVHTRPAPITDSGWTPMFVPAAAVVVEAGGEPSHAVTGACSAPHDGDLIEVDGSTGTVRVLERA